MMKVFCIAVAVLSFVSVCQPASLACNTLLTPADKNQELLGRWHIIAISLESCSPSWLFYMFILPTFAMDITSKDKPNTYDLHIKIKVYGYCFNETKVFFHENSTMFNISRKNSPIGDPALLLQTSCPDCIVIKSKGFADTLILLSKRKTVSDAELKEFDTQTQCLGWPAMKKLNKDFDFDNCRSLDDVSDEEVKTFGNTIILTMFERMSVMFNNSDNCFTDNIRSHFSSS